MARNSFALVTAEDGDTLAQRVPISASCPRVTKTKRRHAHKKH